MIGLALTIVDLLISLTRLISLYLLSFFRLSLILFNAGLKLFIFFVFCVDELVDVISVIDEAIHGEINDAVSWSYVFQFEFSVDKFKLAESRISPLLKGISS